MNCKSILILMFFTLGCNQPETKKVIKKFSNGNDKTVFHYTGDTSSYRVEEFYESGRIAYVGNIEKKHQIGTWTWWYENGKKKDQCKYADGFLEDTVYHWYQNGNLKQIEVVGNRLVKEGDNCSCSGLIIKYFENGKLREEGSYTNKKKEGIWKYYDTLGLTSVRNYQADVLSGLTTEFLRGENMGATVKGQFENGKETGQWKWFNKDSVLFQTQNFVKGKENGEYITYFPNGNVKEKGVLVDGELEGALKSYDEHGQLIKTRFFVKGKQKQ